MTWVLSVAYIALAVIIIDFIMGILYKYIPQVLPPVIKKEMDKIYNKKGE